MPNQLEKLKRKYADDPIETQAIKEGICLKCLRSVDPYMLSYHRRHCELPGGKLVNISGDTSVYAVSMKSPKKQLQWAAAVVCTMHQFDEVPGDLAGFYSLRHDSDEEDQPHCFVAVHNGRVAGCAIIRKRIFGVSTQVEQSEREKYSWCIDKIWIYKPYRRLGIATSIVRGVRWCFQVPICDLKWLPPFTYDGRKFHASIASDSSPPEPATFIQERLCEIREQEMKRCLASLRA